MTTPKKPRSYKRTKLDGEAAILRARADMLCPKCQDTIDLGDHYTRVIVKKGRRHNVYTFHTVCFPIIEMMESLT